MISVNIMFEMQSLSRWLWLFDKLNTDFSTVQVQVPIAREYQDSVRKQVELILTVTLSMNRLKFLHQYIKSKVILKMENFIIIFTEQKMLEHNVACACCGDNYMLNTNKETVGFFSSYFYRIPISRRALVLITLKIYDAFKQIAAQIFYLWSNNLSEMI